MLRTAIVMGVSILSTVAISIAVLPALREAGLTWFWFLYCFEVGLLTGAINDAIKQVWP